MYLGLKNFQIYHNIFIFVKNWLINGIWFVVMVNLLFVTFFSHFFSLPSFLPFFLYYKWYLVELFCVVNKFVFFFYIIMSDEHWMGNKGTPRLYFMCAVCFIQKQFQFRLSFNELLNEPEKEIRSRSKSEKKRVHSIKIVRWKSREFRRGNLIKIDKQNHFYFYVFSFSRFPRSE